MPEAAVHETNVAAIVKANAPQPRADVTVVTPENVDAYVDKQLGKEAPSAKAEPEKAAESPEAKAAEELKKVEKEKAERLAKEQPEEIDHPDKEKRGKLNERFSELTKARKEAEAKAEREARVAREAAERADAAERMAAELRAKYEPAKTDELGPEPQPEQFTDVKEYALALKDYTAEKVRRDDAQKAAAERQTKEREATAKAFQERLEKAKKDVPDFEKKLAGANVRISDQARDVILKSDVGPQMLLHMAENPEFADNLAKLTVGDMQYELGKLAATLGGAKEKPAPAAAQQKAPEISRAAPPISPLNGGGSGEVVLGGHQEFHGSYEDYKAKRLRGQIK